MQPNAQANSISSSRTTSTAAMPRGFISHELAAVFASWRALIGERLYHLGAGGGLALYLVLPTFQIAIFAIIYGRSSELLDYLIVAQAAGAFVQTAIYFNGEILDRERAKGTLVSLFLAPCTRFAWLSGFILVGLLDTGIMMTTSLVFGRLAYGISFNPNLLTLAVSLGLFLAALWGMGLIFSGIGLILRRANAFSNLVHPFILMLGGLYYPVASLPDGLRHIARALPFGYGLQAIADATLHNASLADVRSDLVPLAGFAIALPLLGILTFTWIDRLVRVRGELDLL